MYGICLRYAPSHETAQDLLHDGFIKVFTVIDSYTGKGSLEGWMKRVFVNLALENIRKMKMYPALEEIQNVPDIITDEWDEVESIREEELMKMIEELPDGYRTVFNLYAIENFSHKEIAAMLGIAESTSRSQYIRARQLLQEKILKFLKNKG